METLEDIKWVDTHCHLQLMGDEINEEDISNLEYFIIPGVDVPSSLKAKEFSLTCLLYTSPSPRDCRLSRMPSSA